MVQAERAPHHDRAPTKGVDVSFPRTPPHTDRAVIVVQGESRLDCSLPEPSEGVSISLGVYRRQHVQPCLQGSGEIVWPDDGA